LAIAVEKKGHTMKVNAYQVVAQQGVKVKFQDALEKIMTLPKEERLLTLDIFDVRLEHLNVTSRGVYEVEFSKRLHQDVGKLSGHEAMKSIPLKQGEDFGTYTAGIYVPSKKYLLLEYNHAGARSGSIRDYVSAYSGTEGSGYDLNVKLNDGITADTIKKRNIPKLEIAIASKRLTEADKTNNQGLIYALSRVSDKLGGDAIRVIVSCEQVKPSQKRPGKFGLEQDEIIEFAQDAYEIYQRDPLALKAMFIARDGRGQPEDILSFVGVKLEYKEVVPEHTGERKYPLEEKLKVLYGAYSAWNRIL